MSEALALGIDIGATRVRACVADGRGRILRRTAAEIKSGKSVEDYLDGLIKVAGDALGETVAAGRIEKVGVGSVGPMDLRHGGIRPVNLPYDFLPIVDTLKDAFRKDVVLVNDATAGALAERVFGAGKHHPNLVYVTISTGIGGGAIVDGRLLLGKDGNAVEAGHITVDSLFRLACGCGKRGHWEGYCSGKNIPQFAQLIIDNLSTNEKRDFSRSGLLAEQMPMTAKGIFWEALNGDGLALQVIDEVGKLNSIGISDLVNVFDPSLITVGGSVALNNSTQIVGPVKKHLPHHAMNRLPMIRVTPLGEDIVLLGAVAAALNPQLQR